jgi:acyl-lipid omega-6 desaturase (Delta-12 desaturase)
MTEPTITAPRTGKELLRATEPFAAEIRHKSWLQLAGFSFLLVAALTGAAAAPWWWLQLALGLFGALMMVSVFVLYHDYMHGSILRRSRLAEIVFFLVGSLLLVPPRSWRHSHNYHHGKIGELHSSSVGSFPILTTAMWSRATTLQRLGYRIARHPLTIASAYLTVFFFSVCLQPLLQSPRHNWDSAVALALHGSAIAALSIFAGPTALLFAFFLPLVVASALGAYLFYAQHNYEGVRILPSEQWSYHEASLESSSFLRLGAVMRWVTRNIGFHHVHHLNSRIPSYRLPEAMAAIPELQNPVVTTLHPRDVRACLRLKLWDEDSQRMVGFREARVLARRAAG